MRENSKDLVSKLRENHSSNYKKGNLSGFGKEIESVAKEVKDHTKRSIFDYQGNPQNYNQNKNRAIIGFGTGLLSGLFIPGLAIIGLTYGSIKVYQAYRDKKAQRYYHRDERGLNNNGS